MSKIDSELEQILSVWGSEDALDEYLEFLVSRLHQDISGACTPVPVVMAAPSFAAHFFGFARSCGAEYIVAKNGIPARIIIYFPHLLDAQHLRVVVAHELIHHWEAVGSRPPPSIEEPDLATTSGIIERRFPDKWQRNIWEAGHSVRFISMAITMSKRHSFEIEALLFD